VTLQSSSGVPHIVKPQQQQRDGLQKMRRAARQLPFFLTS
jgi:hypothetical protein